MLFEGDMADGTASFNTTVRLRDATALASYAAGLKPAVSGEPAGPKGEQPGKNDATPPSAETAEAKTQADAGTLKVPPKREAVPVKKDAHYWADRAYLCTTYGNDESAIHFFKKAISLSPRSSNLYFQMGISYAELGYYQAALAAIDKAIDLGGDKGLYYYGRGRVLLQSGKTEAGMVYIEKAAAMGDPDAIQHLEGMAQKPAG
jgi:tetratricopeptide (TPR) repeat protein